MNALVKSWQILKRRWLPAVITLGAVLGTASVYNFLQKPIYEAKGRISSVDRKQVQPGTSSVLTAKNTPAQWIKSLPVAKNTVDVLQLDRTPNQVLENIIVQNITNQNILEVSYRDTEPKRAAQVVQQLMGDYIAQDTYFSRQEITYRQAGLTKQLESLSNDIKLAETNWKNLQKNSKITNYQNEEKSLTAAIKTLQEESEKAKIQLAKLPEFPKIFKQSSITSLRSVLGNPSSTAQQILPTWQGITEKLALEKTKLSPNGQLIKSLQAQQTALQKKLQEESRQSLVNSSQFKSQLAKLGVAEDAQYQLVQALVQRDGIEKRITALQASIDKGQSQVAALSPQKEQLRLQEQNLKAAQDQYQKVAAELKLLQSGDGNQVVPTTQILQAAISGRQPIAAPHRIHPVWMMLVGLSLGGAVAGILERTDKRLQNAAAVRKLAKYPILGHIPNFSPWTTTKNSALLTTKDDQPEHEPFRTLRSNLKFLDNQDSTRVIVIASGVHQEGKSTVAAHLALTSSQNGQRVLLVDADLHHPRQHELWQVSNSIGLSNLLQDDNQFPESIIEISENLELLPAGLNHPRPSDLFSSSAMAEIFNQWFSLYDLVIVDTTPLNLFTEAITLSKMSDGLILVASPQISESADFENAQSILQKAQLNVFGVVINAVENYEYYQLILATPDQNERGDFLARTTEEPVSDEQP